VANILCCAELFLFIFPILLVQIGKGGFGVVYKALLGGRKLVSVKELSVKEESVGIFRYREFNHEVFIMSQLEHPNLVRLFGMSMNPLSLIMEFLPYGSLDRLYRNKDPLPQVLTIKLR